MSALRSRGSDDSGSVLILTAVSMVVLMGMMALALDVGFWFDRRIALGAAADAAAWAGAQEVKANSSISSLALRDYAKHEVMNNLHYLGLEITDDGHGNTVKVDVYHPPQSGSYTCALQPTTCNQYVEVIVSQDPPIFFAQVLGLNASSFSLGNRSVAGPSSDTAGCIYALNTVGQDAYWSGYELDIDGNNSHVTATNCALVSNGGFNVDTGSTVNATATSVVASHMTGGGTVTPAAQFSQPKVADPLADMDQGALFGIDEAVDVQLSDADERDGSIHAQRRQLYVQRMHRDAPRRHVLRSKCQRGSRNARH